MDNKQKILFITIFILAVIVTLSLFLINIRTPTGAVVSDIKEIDFAINYVPHSALLFIAEEKGYFKEQGLKFNYHGFQTGKQSLDALLGGGADICSVADVPVALAGLADQKISVITTLGYSTNNIQVTARKDSGIEKPKDLVGKDIATAGGGGPLYFTHKFLERYNIDKSDVNLLLMKPSDMLTAFLKGDIDAFIVFEPFPYLARKELGNKVIIFNPDDLYGETWNIAVMKDFERKNPETVRKFIKALVKAEMFLNQNPDESQEIISKYTEIDRTTLIEIEKKWNYGIVLNELLPDYLFKEAEWAIEEELTSSTEIPNYYELINTDHLKSVKPKGVTI